MIQMNDGRLPPYPLDEVSGQLILTNLSLTYSGTYRCVATNQMGSASCELTLSVTGRGHWAEAQLAGLGWRGCMELSGEGERKVCCSELPVSP